MQYVIFHGTFGSASGNWFPWLVKELKDRDQHVICPQFPEESHEEVSEALKKNPEYKPQKITLKNWLSYFEQEVLPQLKKDEDICFIGHSLGPLFILNILNTLPLKLAKAYFVAPFLTLDKLDPAYDVVVDDFSGSELDFEKIRGQMDSSLVIYAKNDPYVPEHHVLEFADKTGSVVLALETGGHLNYEFGFTEFPVLLEEIDKDL